MGGRRFYIIYLGQKVGHINLVVPVSSKLDQIAKQIRKQYFDQRI